MAELAYNLAELDYNLTELDYNLTKERMVFIGSKVRQKLSKNLKLQLQLSTGQSTFAKRASVTSSYKKITIVPQSFYQQVRKRHQSSKIKLFSGLNFW